MDVPLVMRYNANIVQHRLLFIEPRLLFVEPRLLLVEPCLLLVEPRLLLVEPSVELLAQLVKLSLQKLLDARETRLQTKFNSGIYDGPLKYRIDHKIINGLRVSRSRWTRFLAVSTISSFIICGKRPTGIMNNM